MRQKVDTHFQPISTILLFGFFNLLHKIGLASLPLVAVEVMARGIQEQRSFLAQNDLRILCNRLLLSKTRFGFIGGSGVGALGRVYYVFFSLQRSFTREKKLS